MHHVNQINYPSVEDAVRAQPSRREASRTTRSSLSGFVRLDCPCCGSLVVMHLEDRPVETQRPCRQVEVSFGGRS
jgi:hypothetical protein